MATVPRQQFEELPAEEPEALPSFPENRREQRIEAVHEVPELSRNEVLAEYPYGASRNGLDLNVEEWEPAADRVQMLTRGRELNEQEHFDGSPEGRWTLQQFSTNPLGEPWMALQERDDDGNVQRTFTGTRPEMEQLISDNNLTVTELAPITEGEYYRQALGRMGLEPEIRQEEGFSVSV